MLDVPLDDSLDDDAPLGGSLTFLSVDEPPRAASMPSVEAADVEPVG